MVVKVVRLSRRVVEYSRRFRSLDRSNLAIGFVLRTIFLSRSLFVEEHFVGLAMKLSSLIISGGAFGIHAYRVGLPKRFRILFS